MPLSRSLALAFGLAVLPQACGRQQHASTPSTSQVAWTAPIEVATGPAVRGPWNMNESDYRWVDDPAVDFAPNGEIVVAWVDQTRKDLFVQRYDVEGRALLPSATNASKSPTTFSWLPRLVVDETSPSVVYVLWQEIVFSGGTHGGEIFFARSPDGGRTFSPPENLSHSIAGDGKGRLDEKTWDNGSLDLTRAPNGDLYAAWTEYEGTLWLRHAKGAREWERAVHVAGTKEKPARAPSIAVTNDALFIAWAVGEDRHGKVHVARSPDGGASFGTPIVIGDDGARSDAPQLAVEENGTLHLVFTQGTNVHYARMMAGASTFERPRPIGEGTAPTVGVDTQRRVYVVWERHDGDRRRGLGFACSLDGGDRFAEASEVPHVGGEGVNGSQQGNLADKLAVDRNGALAVVNSTFAEDRESRVRLVRGRLR